jgi:4-amino-4-deoxy-L-arabinose transferase-like glycosyltransferase
VHRLSGFLSFVSLKISAIKQFNASKSTASPKSHQMKMNAKDIALIFLILTVSLIIRIPGLCESLWWDEVYRTHLVLNKDGLWSRLFFDVHNFMYNGFMYLWINIFGDSEISIRMPSLLFGYASVAVIWTWASRTFNQKIATCIAVWILISPFHIWYSTEAKNNSMVMFFAIMIFVSYYLLIEEGKWKWSIAAAVAGILGIFTDFLLGLSLLSAWTICMIVLIKEFSADRFKKLFIPFVLTLWYTLPLIIFKFENMEGLFRKYLKPFDFKESFLFLFNYLPNGNAILPIRAYGGLNGVCDPWTISLLIASGFLLAILLLNSFLKLGKRREVLFLSAFFAVPLICMYLMTLYVQWKYRGGHYLYIERNLGSLIFYFYSVLLILGASLFKNKIVRNLFIGAFFTITITGTVMMLTVNKDKWTVYKPNPDWRSFAAYLKQGGSGGLVFTSCPHGAIDYYLIGSNFVVKQLILPKRASEEELRSYIRKEIKGHGNGGPGYFYLAINRFWGAATGQKRNIEVLSRQYVLIEKRNYLGLHIYKYRIRVEDSECAGFRLPILTFTRGELRNTFVADQDMNKNS